MKIDGFAILSASEGGYFVTDYSELSDGRVLFAGTKDGCLKYVSDKLKSSDPLSAGAIPVEAFNLSSRVLNCLKAYGISTLGQLRTADLENLRRDGNFGDKSHAEVVKFLGIVEKI